MQSFEWYHSGFSLLQRPCPGQGQAWVTQRTTAPCFWLQNISRNLYTRWIANQRSSQSKSLSQNSLPSHPYPGTMLPVHSSCYPVQQRDLLLPLWTVKTPGLWLSPQFVTHFPRVLSKKFHVHDYWPLLTIIDSQTDLPLKSLLTTWPIYVPWTSVYSHQFTVSFSIATTVLIPPIFSHLPAPSTSWQLAIFPSSAKFIQKAESRSWH